MRHHLTDPHVPESFAAFAFAMGCFFGSLFEWLAWDGRRWPVVATFAVVMLYVGFKAVRYRRSRP